MTEIQPNQPNIPQQPQKIEQVKTDAVQEPQNAPAVDEAPAKEITEIPENPADRSTVKPADNLEADIKLFTENTELAQKALDIAELAEKRYAEAGVKDAELKALNVGKAFVEEFQK
ncbi:hypothetical protein J6P92_01270 [bacterium]|nr:hypothetical protein [bacterium]